MEQLHFTTIRQPQLVTTARPKFMRGAPHWPLNQKRHNDNILLNYAAQLGGRCRALHHPYREEGYEVPSVEMR